MFEKITTFVAALMICAVVGYLYTTHPWAKDLPYKEGDCLKMDFPGVEAWHYGMIARVDTIGKQNYGVKYWLEYGWSSYTDTWPFSLSVVKVQCPQETRNDNQ
jgi:hypothetical protein